MEEGMKFDNEKPQTDLLLDFSRALIEVAKLATFGAKKYAPHNWQFVENGEVRYTAALLRHLFEGQVKDIDEDTGLSHDIAVAWNALARLELKLRRLEHEYNTTI